VPRLRRHRFGTVRRSRINNDQNLARFDTAEIATYWIKERGSSDYLRVWDEKEKKYVVCPNCESSNWNKLDDTDRECQDCGTVWMK
jgi:hypothetical protein